jgi:hypothetical protein
VVLTRSQRIGQWYRDQYGGLLKSDKAAFKDLFTGILDNPPPKPQRPRIEHYFSRKYYDTLVKDVVAERWAAEEERARRAGVTSAKKIDIVAKATAEVWNGQSEEFKQECQLALEREYQQVVKAWEASLADSPTRTADEIAAYVVV